MVPAAVAKPMLPMATKANRAQALQECNEDPDCIGVRADPCTVNGYRSARCFTVHVYQNGSYTTRCEAPTLWRKVGRRRVELEGYEYVECRPYP